MSPGPDEAEVLRFEHDRVGGRQRHRASQRVLQLADVAWPRVGTKTGPRGVGYVEVGPAQICQHAMNERWEIGEAVAERRNRDDDHGQAKEKVLTEAPRSNVRAEIPVRGRNDSNVDRSILSPTDTSNPSAFERTQEARLKIHRELADLVEKERPVMRPLEGTGMGPHRTRKCTTLVSQKLTLGEVCDDGAAVENDQRPRRATAPRVERMSEYVFPDAGLAAECHGRVRRREALENVEYFVHRRR